MIRKTYLLYSGILLLAFLISVLILNSPTENPRSEYEKELVAMYKQIPEDVIEESEGENRPDRPDLAAMQNYFTIMDPELKAVPVERLIMAWDEINTMNNSVLKQDNPLLCQAV